MFGWRKRTEGFEWREYVRTTILVRRADRQRKLDDARLAALAKMTAERDRRLAAVHGFFARLQRAIRRMMRRAGVALTAAMRRVVDTLGRGLSKGFEHLKGLPLPQLDLPPWAKSAAGHIQVAMPSLRGLDFSGYGSALAAALVAVLLAGAGWLMPRTALLPASFSTPAANPQAAPKDTANVADDASGKDVSGRAIAVSGELLRIAGMLVHLKGIEAPELHQICAKGSGRTWPCGSAAREALSKLVRGKNVDCDVTGKDGAGRPLATCYAAEHDLAAELVRSGHAFAEGGFFQAYASEEANARAGKAGLWQGDAERPSAWRQRLWEEAKKSAPDGCPIKGLVRGNGRIYAMPWSKEYGGGKVRAVKGERWFCSEEEARAAGFKLSERS